MKKTQHPDGQNDLQKDMLEEYRFDYSKAKPNRFATATSTSLRTIVLDPDVAEVLTSEEAVNSVLRALIQTMPVAAMPTRVAESDH